MRLAVFVSGRGSNMKALLDENPEEEIFVFSNKKTEPKAFGWAKKRGAVTDLVSLQTEKEWLNLAQKINELKIRKVFLLGFMKIVPEVFLSRLKAECLNLHPSMLPDFPGLKSIEKTFEARNAMGCTVHRVSKVVDAGTICLQKRVSDPCSNLKDFEEQVHFAEQEVVSKFCTLRLSKAEVG